MATERAARTARPARFRLRSLDLEAPLTAGLVLGGMCLVSALVRVWLARKIVTPWIMVDELIYSELAKSFATGGDFLIRGMPSGVKSVVYPAVIAPAWWADSMSTTYAIAKSINAVVMTLTAVPVYLWGSRLASRRWALVAGALTLLMPSLIYSGTLMTETAFFPVFVLAAFAIAASLERPTAMRQLLALAVVALACGIRLQGLVLLGIVPTTILLGLLFELRAGTLAARQLGRALLRFWPTAAAFAVAVCGYVFYKLAQGASLSSGLGSYREVTARNYSVGEVARWVLYHVAELPFSVAMLPASAFLLLLGLALRRGGTTGTAERAFLAVTASSVAWIVVEVAAFASRFSLRMEERYMFCLAPLLLLALVLWLSRDLPRPPLLTIVAAVVPAALLVFLPLGRLLNISITSEAFGLIPLLRVSNGLAGNTSLVKILLLAGGAAAAVAFALTPRRLAVPGFPLAVAVFFFAVSWTVHGTVRDYAKALHAAGGMSSNPNWIDDAVPAGEKAAFLYGTDVDPFQQASLEWQMDFWNRQLGPPYDLAAQEPALAGTLVAADPKTGRLVLAGTTMPVRTARYLVAESNVDIAGRRVAIHPPYSLYAVNRPLRLASSTTGVYSDRWMGADASYSRFAATAPGRMQVLVSRAAWGGPASTARVVVSVAAEGTKGAVRRVMLPPTQTRIVQVPTPPRPFVVTVHVSPTFSPSQFGQADTRQLGAQVSFAYAPGP